MEMILFENMQLDKILQPPDTIHVYSCLAYPNNSLFLWGKNKTTRNNNNNNKMPYKSHLAD